MRINLVLGPFQPPPPAPTGAIEKVWWQLGATFASQGHDVTILFKDHPDIPQGETLDGMRAIRLPGPDRSGSVKRDVLFRDSMYSFRAWRRLPPADITVSNCFWLPLLLRRVSRRKAGVLNVHIQRFPKGQMWLYGNADRLSTVSKAISDAMIAENPSLEPLIEIIGNPVDVDAFHPASDVRAPGDSPCIVFTGRIHPEKGLNLLVEACGRLRDEFPGLRLRLIGRSSIESGGGGDEYVQQLRGMAGDLQLEFPGGFADPNELAEEIRSADVYCYPSVAFHGEASPVAPLEAMACGLPPVVSDLPQFADYVKDGETGLVFAREGEGAVDQLTDCLRRMLTDEALRTRLRNSGIERAQAFSYPAIADAYLQDFERTLR